MTTYPHDDDRYLDPDDPARDPVASHGKRDIIDPDFQPVPEDEPADDRGVGEKLSDAAGDLADKVKQGWDNLTDDDKPEEEDRLQEDEAEARRVAERANDPLI